MIDVLDPAVPLPYEGLVNAIQLEESDVDMLEQDGGWERIG